MSDDGDSLSSQMETVARRVDFVELLRKKGPLRTGSIVDELSHSRSTVTRALRALREACLVEKTDEGYVTTTPAELAAEQYQRYETGSRAILASKPLLEPMLREETPPVDLLIGADRTTAAETDSVRLFEEISARVSRANRVIGYLPTLVNTHLLRVWHREVVTENKTGTGLFDPEALTVLKGQYPELLSGLAGTDRFRAIEIDGPSYGIVLTEGDTGDSVSVVVYDNTASVRGVIHNDSEAAVDWARDTFADLRDRGTTVTSDLKGLSADGGTQRVGDTVISDRDNSATPKTTSSESRISGVPVELKQEGFDHLSAEYFQACHTAPPSISWRTGFTLSEVHAGQTVERYDAEGESLTDQLIEALRTGTDQALLGPPGSGKSTVCMSVACTWYERGLGPVLYRERGSGDSFESTALLEAFLRRADEHALVVVEDAVRAEANRIFTVIRAVDSDPNVTFLLDARTQEWRDPESAIDPRWDAHRRANIEVRELPQLDERECQRFIDRFVALTETDIGLTGNDLFELLDVGTVGNRTAANRTTAGTPLAAQYYLTRRGQPFASADSQPPTALDGVVERTYRSLADHETAFTLDVAILANLLNAAGIPVAIEYLYAIATPEEFTDIETALEALNGEVIFAADSSLQTRASEYRTRHETWSVRFLKQFKEEVPPGKARARVSRGINRLLALADEPERRLGIERHLGGSTPYLHRIAADPSRWADELVGRLLDVGRSNSGLAPLFGESESEEIQFPSACSPQLAVREPYWRGQMYRKHGDLDRAEREFHTLRDRAAAIELPSETTLEPVSVSIVRSYDGHDADESLSLETWRRHWKAVAATELGTIARLRGNLDTATEYHKQSLAHCQEIGDRFAEAVTYKNLGNTAYKQGNLVAAREYYQQSLTRYQEAGDRHGEAKIQLAFGNVERDQGKLEAAREYYDRSLDQYREVGSPSEEALPLLAIGAIARKQNNLEVATEHLSESLARYRESGSKHGEAMTLGELGLVAIQQRALDTAGERLTESLELYQLIDDRQGEAHTLSYLGRLSRERGELETASERFKQSLDYCREIGDNHGQATALLGLGKVASERGTLDDAREHLTEAVERCLRMDAAETEHALTELLDVCIQQDRPELAAEWCRKGIEFAERTDRPELREMLRHRASDLPNKSN